MTKAKVPFGVAAVVLAVLTLAVFYVLQDYGPASAIRRFHAALATGDVAALQQVIDSPVKSLVDDPQQKFLIGYVKQFVDHGIQPQVARMDRQPGSVRVAVVYTLQNHDRYAIVWIVDKKGPLWKINIKLTAAILKDTLLQ